MPSHKQASCVHARYALSISLLAAFPITALAGWPERTHDGSIWRNGPGATNHPVNVIPSSAVTIPPGWPVDSRGAIVCTTCHSSVPRGDGSGANLRDADAKTRDSRAFCANCHTPDGPSSAAGAHWMALSMAHPSREAIDRAGPRRGGDNGSHTCLACHDGVSARDAAYGTGHGREPGFLGDKSRNHPIGVPYPRGGTRAVEVPLRPAALLPQAIALPGGYVSCTSCHNLYSPDPMRLSVPIEGSKLCFSCHDMD